MGLIDNKETTQPGFEACVRGCIKILEKAGNLKVLRLVLHVCHHFDDVPLTPFKLSTAKFDNLSIVLVHLHRSEWEEDNIDSSQTDITEIRRLPGDDFTLQTFADPKAWAKAKGWVYKEAWYDYKGTYPMHEHYNCAVVAAERQNDNYVKTDTSCKCKVAETVRTWHELK